MKYIEQVSVILSCVFVFWGCKNVETTGNAPSIQPKINEPTKSQLWGRRGNSASYPEADSQTCR